MYIQKLSCVSITMYYYSLSLLSRVSPETTVPRPSSARRTWRSRTWRVSTITVWRQGRGSDQWTTSLVARKLWPLWHFSSPMHRCVYTVYLYTV